MTDWIGDTFTSETGWSLLEDLVDIGDRMAGSAGEARAARLTAETLEAIGARNVRRESFDIQGWQRGSSAVHTDETTEACIALPRSPSERATGDLVDLGYGLPADYEDADIDGAVVMARSDVPSWHDRYIHRREKYYRAVQGGAVAFIYRNHVEGQLPPTGSLGTPENPIGEIPGVGVSAEVGARLARRWADDSVTVEVDASIEPATSQNVHAELGPDTDEAVLLTSHVDAHDIAEGAMDNGAGTAMVAEIARALAGREDALDTRVHVIVFGAEEVGLLGSEAHASRADLDAIKTVINNDGVVRGRTLELHTQGFDALEDAGRAVADRFDHPIEFDPTVGPHSDHWPYVKWGVPGYHAMSDTGEQGRGWGHTEADTLDKVESRTLREQAVLLTALTEHVASDDFSVDRRDADEIARALEEQDQAEEMKLVGDWPYA